MIKESPSMKGLNPEKDLIRTPIETDVSNTKLEGTKEDKPDSLQFVRRNCVVMILKF